MNILPKKSWHVRNKDNIERVRRDEAKAAEEEKEKERRIALAEQEARTNFLRQKAKARRVRDDTTDHTEVACSSSHRKEEHVNFFQDLEDGKKQKKGNEDHARERREEKEKYEKSIGLLTYLGQSAIESQHDKPWYQKSSKKQKEDSNPTFEADLKRKKSLDPLAQMSDYLEMKHKSDSAKHKHHKKHKKHTHQHSEKQERKAKTIEELRAERMKREREERVRQAEVVAKAREETLPGSKPANDTVETDERKRRYNSQFNPDFVRVKKRRHYYD